MQFTLTATSTPVGECTIVLLPGLFAGGWIWQKAADRMTANGLQNVSIVNESFAVADCMLSGVVSSATDFVMHSLENGGDQRPIILCGNSFGGVVALDAAARFPDRVAAVVVSGAPGLTPDISFGLPQRADLSFAYSAVARLFHDQRRVPLDRVEETFNILARPGPLRNVVKGLKASRIYDVRGALAKLRCRSLFVWGEFDEVSPLEPWVQPISEMPLARLEVIPDSGHSPMLEQPEAFADRVTEFLKETKLQSSPRTTASVGRVEKTLPDEHSAESPGNCTSSHGSWNAVDSTPAYRDLNRKLVNMISIPKNGVVLDVGSGSGGVSSIVLNAYPNTRICAVDPGMEMLDAIPTDVRSRVECLCARAEDLGEHMPDDFADSVFLANCIHLFTDRAKAFSAIHNVLKPGGSAAMSTTYFEGGKSAVNAHFERELIFSAVALLLKRFPEMKLSRKRDSLASWLDSREIVTELERAGFKEVRSVVCEIQLNAEALVEMMGSTHFAGALFPGVSANVAADVLREAAQRVMEKNAISEVARNWLFVIAHKEAFYDG